MLAKNSALPGHRVRGKLPFFREQAHSGLIGLVLCAAVVTFLACAGIEVRAKLAINRNRWSRSSGARRTRNTDR